MLSEVFPPDLTPNDLAVLGALLASQGRIISRKVLSRNAGLSSQSERQVDVSLVAIRKVLGKDALLTVRSRGWMLSETGTQQAKKFLNKESGNE